MLKCLRDEWPITLSIVIGLMIIVLVNLEY